MICEHSFESLHWALSIWGMVLPLHCKELVSGKAGSLVAFNRKCEKRQDQESGRRGVKSSESLCTYRAYPGISSCIKQMRGLPWWHSGWESAYQCRGHGFEPWSGKIPHAVEQLGPWAIITEPARLEPVLRNRRGRDSERPAHRDEEALGPLAATRESPRTETKTQHSHK